MKNNEKISLEEAKKKPYYWTTYLFEGIDPNDLHVTHKFLKSQSEEDKEDILSILNEYWNKNVFESFTPVFDTEDFFGENRDIRVLRCNDSRFNRTDLRDKLDKFAEDQHGSYKPHVTTDLPRLKKKIIGYAFMYGKHPIKIWGIKNGIIA